jgi:hypothetical protein
VIKTKREKYTSKQESITTQKRVSHQNTIKRAPPKIIFFCLFEVNVTSLLFCVEFSGGRSAQEDASR